MSRKQPAIDPPAPQPAQDELAALRRQLAQLTDALQRERADAINLRRRYEEQLAGARDAAKAGVIRALLPIIDNFERSLKHVPAELAANEYIKGVRGIVKQFDATLGSLGVRRIETVGRNFDPELHEAVSMEDGDGKNEIVSEELQPGYSLDNGTVIRHAMVRVKAA